MTTSEAADGAVDQRWIVHKFGGSSVADADCIARVAGIIEADPGSRVAVVLSACKGVTDSLLELVTLAEQRSRAASERLAAIEARHAGIAGTLLDAAGAAAYVSALSAD
jgi:bifunctional aspartokinase / homoserine dehydrogenase 1